MNSASPRFGAIWTLTPSHWKSNSSHSTPEMIRTANQDGLLQGEWEQWHTFRDRRNQISHTYNEDQAAEVAASIPAFLEEVRFLHHRMEALAT